MSYLIRTGNGRTNISWSTTANSSTKYLRRTATGRNNIVWTTIPQGSTYNILQRNGTSRNNILYANLKIGPDLSANGIKNNMYITTTTWRYSMPGSVETYDNIYIAIKGTNNSVSIRGTYTDPAYSANKITFQDFSNITNNAGTIRLNENPNYSAFINECVFIVFCSQIPPSEYLNVISSISVSSSRGQEVYTVKDVMYGYIDFLKNNNKFNNCLSMSLDTDVITTYSDTIFSINFL